MTPSEFDCFKHPVVQQLESLEFTPFHIISLILFGLAVLHTLCVYKIYGYARKLEAKHVMNRREKATGRPFGLHILYFLSEVEVVFALWAIPLFICMNAFYGWQIGLEYINSRDYTEPLFVVVILAMASTRPIVHAAERIIKKLAQLFGGTLSAWWLTLLTAGPLLGSFITEAAAMALCAILLSRKFFAYHPSKKLSYATLALLFVNISVGGILTDFASPAVLILAHCWEWSMSDMFFLFGWKAILGILISNFLYWYYFRKELSHLHANPRSFPEDDKIPAWIIAVHIAFMAWIVSVSHYPAIFIASFLFFIGFHQATRKHQHAIRLSRPLLIGLFLAGLVIHGGLQGWWVIAMLDGLSPLSVMGVAMALTGFNDNAAIAYLVSIIPNWGEVFKYAVFTGVVAGGGLTVIANAPNPAGYAILRKHFDGGVKPIPLFLGALIPTLILYALFYLFGPLL